MAYEKQNFKDGQCLCGHHLNHIEEGIVKLEEEIENGGGSSGGSAYIDLEIGEDGTAIHVTNPDGTIQMATVRNGEDGKNGEPGIVWKGEWNAETSYTSLKNGQLSRDAVYYNGSAYVLKNTVSPVVGVIPEGDTTKWELLAKGGEVSEEKKTTSVDLSGFESGTVVENFSDGSTLTYSFEFNEDGKITKITDSDGNETVLTW